ncbi:hypothetical protein [Massilia pseudoviolaceinigra]|uniref:hypothetical protein n=1 Tax=Massilia pseudoviolaceinigra TaxID=3057165 RepID=UPI0027966591|nr:hypothetical protein [Massilia sp. CCM 9206]MDQ1924677.1 hypothetical protein [Massilia sp. CCM 9206]
MNIANACAVDRLRPIAVIQGLRLRQRSAHLWLCNQHNLGLGTEDGAQIRVELIDLSRCIQILKDPAPKWNFCHREAMPDNIIHIWRWAPLILQVVYVTAPTHSENGLREHIRQRPQSSAMTGSTL